MANQGPAQTKRERQRERAEAKRAAERKAQQRRTLGYTLGGIALIALVVVLVVTLMGGGESSGSGGPSAQGEVTVAGPARDTPLQPGEAVPAFTAPEVFGGSVSWDDYMGRPAVLSVWAPWCPHCQEEIPLVDQVMREEFPDVGWVTIVTSVGDQPGPDPASFLSENGIEPTTAVDDSDETLARAFGIVAFPTLYFINSDGTVATEYEGEIDEATLRSMVESLT